MSRVGAVLIPLALRVNDVDSDVALNDFRQEAVDRAADGRDELGSLRAACLCLECALQGFDLAPDSPNPTDQFGLLTNRMAHAPESIIG